MQALHLTHVYNGKQGIPRECKLPRRRLAAPQTEITSVAFTIASHDMKRRPPEARQLQKASSHHYDRSHASQQAGSQNPEGASKSGRFIRLANGHRR